jgi:signal transduction histidine kinase
VLRIGSFELDEAEVEGRKRYLEIGPPDEQRLRDAHPHLERHAGAIIDRFYEYLLSHESTRAMLSAPGIVDRLKQLQLRYFTELTSGNYGLAYFENRLRVGQAHHRIGLSPEWYLGAYVKYLHIAAEVLGQAFAGDHERFFQAMISLTKVIYLDMGLALDAYHYSAQEGLANANRDLRQLQAAKQRLTDMIVHDLQNPLTGITSALRVIAGRPGGLSEGERGALDEALRRCDDLSAMIMNLLQVSRAEEDKLPTYLENLDLSSLAGQVVDSFRKVASQEGRLLKIDAPPGVAVRTDQTLVRRILENLLRNALRHTPPGTRVTVRVAGEADGRARLSVQDDGPGVPPEMQPLLFEPFGSVRLREAGRRVDTGLGLASCRAAANALGADLTVASDGKRGTVFTLLLP